MKTIIFTTLLALAAARPDRSYAPVYARSDSNSAEVAHVVRDDRVAPSATGLFSYDVETSNGIRVSQSGAEGGAAQGSVTFTHPNGEKYELTFVADGEGYKPVSSALPVAPLALHPIPQHALDQIAKAAREDAQGIRYESSSSEESRYYN